VASQLTGKPTPALFLDRDGVVNIDYGYVHRVDQISFVDGIFALCRAARQQGFRTVVVTNQAGIGRGLYSEAEFALLMSWMKSRFIDAGATIDAVYYCPHHPEHGLGAFRRRCSCRKPEPGLLLQAQRDLSLDFSQSILIGDKMSDIEAARRVNIARRFLLSDSGNTEIVPPEVVAGHLNQIRDLVFGPLKPES
jgi:D-glycero-D-manno-heptose 1,7-bisphosphate phosphatase